MEYKTGLAWGNTQSYFNGDLIGIRKDFLAPLVPLTKTAIWP